MNSKAFIILGLLFAVVILLSSEEASATARGLKSVEEAVMETNGDGIEDDKRRFGGGHHGHRHHHRHHHRHRHHCRHGCSADEDVNEDPQAKPNN
ncbi:hypothetical protein SDJN02_16562 [Cucurbita argyrosperma subsp. argyrosperma]